MVSDLIKKNKKKRKDESNSHPIGLQEFKIRMLVAN